MEERERRMDGLAIKIDSLASPEIGRQSLCLDMCG